MICPHCGKSIKVELITHQRGKGLKAEFQCPHCEAWLGKSPLLSKLKITGFYIALISGIYAYVSLPHRHIALPIAILATIMMLVTHMMDQLKIISIPEQPDDSDQRQKYR